jgi:hypothetical protein
MMGGRREDRDIGGPSIPHAIAYRVAVNPIALASIRYRHRLAAHRDTRDIAPIARLGASRCPFAVRRGVVPVYILPLKRAPIWAWSHVAVECLKAAVPFRMNSDATSTIVSEGRVVRVGTAVAHCYPRSILASIRHAVRRYHCRQSFQPKAAAARGRSRFQCPDGNYSHATTIAFAIPSSFASCAGNAESDQAAETVAGEIKCGWHSGMIPWPRRRFKRSLRKVLR